MERKRARAYGVTIGSRPTGELNSITDVAGVRVGHRTMVRDGTRAGGAVRTGVTVVFPHEGQPWEEPVYAGTHVLNGFGEIIGINQVNEWGVLMSPLVMTSSLAIGKAYDATAQWIAGLDPERADESAVMPVVTECDDGFLNDSVSFPLADEDVVAALEAAAPGPVEEGCVGSGTGMQCFDFKGGIGTSSRVLDAEHGGHTVGALVMTNFGDREELRVDGVPVGREVTDLMPEEHTEGSCIAVVATDAPMLPHQVGRLAQRAGLGLARAGSFADNGSGELMIAFSTAQRLSSRALDPTVDVRGMRDGISWEAPRVYAALFAATVEAVEEAVVNALFAAETMHGRDDHVLHALPIERTLELLERHGRLRRPT